MWQQVFRTGVSELSRSLLHYISTQYQNHCPLLNLTEVQSVLQSTLESEAKLFTSAQKETLRSACGDIDQRVRELEWKVEVLTHLVSVLICLLLIVCGCLWSAGFKVRPVKKSLEPSEVPVITIDSPDTLAEEARRIEKLVRNRHGRRA